MEVHCIDVGCGNMTLIKFPNGVKMIYDCNITADNENRILKYLNMVIGENTAIDIFVNSHRDLDHFNGIKTLHSAHPIKKIWETGETGTTPDTQEYRAYMDIRRTVGYEEIKAGNSWNAGEVAISCFNSQYSDYDDPNDQSIVLKFSFKGNSIILAGDTSCKPWKEKILPSFYLDLNASFLLASHHGSKSFFEDATGYYYDHLKKINPFCTIISVGPNPWNLPDKEALEIYTTYSRGLSNGDKVYTTEKNGTIKIVFEDRTATVYKNQ